jgi:hypothetical protein
MTGSPSFTCPRCGAVSHHPDDIREGYCGRCRDWTGLPAWLEQMPLDSPEHIRSAWSMAGHPAVRGRLRGADGLDRDQQDAVIEAMRRKIKRAAWEHGLVLYGS